VIRIKKKNELSRPSGRAWSLGISGVELHARFQKTRRCRNIPILRRKISINNVTDVKISCNLELILIVVFFGKTDAIFCRIYQNKNLWNTVGERSNNIWWFFWAILDPLPHIMFSTNSSPIYTVNRARGTVN